MRIAIMGAGAMGSFLGGFFTRAGFDVTLVNPPSEHVRAIQENGLTLLDGEETFKIPVKITTSPSTLKQVKDRVGRPDPSRSGSAGSSDPEERKFLNHQINPLTPTLSPQGRGGSGSNSKSSLAPVSGESISACPVPDTGVREAKRKFLHDQDSPFTTVTSKGQAPAPFPGSGEQGQGAEELKQVDLIIIMVKSYHTEQAVKDALCLVGPSTYMLSLQNGIGHHIIMNRYMDERRILLGSTSSGAYISKPGQVTVAGKGETFIGALSGVDVPVLENIKNVFVTAGLHCALSGEIIRIIWGKLVVNVGINALTAITRLQNGKLLEYPELEQLLELAVREAVAVAQRKNVKITFPDPVAKVKEVARITAGNRSSMLQDIERKRPTEINVINGAIIEMAEELLLDVPVNRTLFNLVKALEKKDLRETSN